MKNNQKDSTLSEKMKKIKNKQRAAIRVMMERTRNIIRVKVACECCSSCTAARWARVGTMAMRECPVVALHGHAGCYYTAGNIEVNLSNSGFTTTAKVLSAALVKQASHRVKMGLSHVTHSSLLPPLTPTSECAEMAVLSPLSIRTFDFPLRMYTFGTLPIRSPLCQRR